MRVNKILLIVLLVAVAGFAVYRLVREHFASEEARIKKLIREVEKDFENKELKRCLVVVSEEYSDDLGHATRDELEDDLRLLFQVARKIRAKVQDVSISIRGDEADITLTATGTATTTFGDISFRHELGFTRFSIIARQEHGRWKVFRVQGVN